MAKRRAMAATYGSTPARHIYPRFNAGKRARAATREWLHEKAMIQPSRFVRVGGACGRVTARERWNPLDARRHNRTMERLTCVGGPVVYRTAIICPPAITRLNYSSREQARAQTLHCFNRTPIISRPPPPMRHKLPQAFRTRSPVHTFESL